ncbi:hypothetical protein NC653_004430 [Populus alba x Populus x berolinensis]|uniref:Uncharacterized protein n=1 Tax=Populus alba x Populus x berolinensis TaxID=444605 RepID=A0AAD6RTZ4_9ROSI|nr:hypothetical protein NC653_004430 [Populus alba x Populus x berolinensis]
MGNCFALHQLTKRKSCSQSTTTRHEDVLRVMKTNGEILDYTRSIFIKGYGNNDHHFFPIWNLGGPFRVAGDHSPTMDNTSGSKRVKMILTKQELQELLSKKKIAVEEMCLLGMRSVALCGVNSSSRWQPGLETILEESLGVAEGVIKVITSNGGILEFTTPITTGTITNEFPGHAIFPSHDLFWRPLSLQEELHGGQSYYLLPLNNSKIGGQIVREGHVRSKSTPAAAAATSNIVAPYRMSLDYQGMLKRSYTEVFSRYSSKNNYNKSNDGFWKVKLVISPEQLVEILSQEASTEELIENVRAVAKCGNGFSSSASSVDFSDSWSLSSSRTATCKKDSLVDI